MADQISSAIEIVSAPHMTIVETYSARRVLGLWWARHPFIVTTDSKVMMSAWDALAEEHGAAYRVNRASMHEGSSE